MGVTLQSIVPTRKVRAKKIKKSDIELTSLFWISPLEALFSEETISLIAKRSIKTLQCDRWRGRGIPYRKCSGKILYRKSDVIAWIESHQLVLSTSEASVGC